MMFKSFTKREKVLLVVLVLILFSALYYFTVALPSINRISAANEKSASVQDDIMLEMAKMKKIKEMQEKIEEATSANGFKTVIPNYNNLENVMRQMDAFLSSSTDFLCTCCFLYVLRAKGGNSHCYRCHNQIFIA